jgi:hypothetical protein
VTGLLHADETIAMFRMEPNANRFMVDCNGLGGGVVVVGLVAYYYELAAAAWKNRNDLERSISVLIF